MTRTTPELVRSLVDIDSDVELSSFIDTANSIVNDVCLESSYSTQKLELIERWLAAHFASIHSPQNFMEGVSGIQEQREILKVDLGLNLTKYGQQAMRVDTAGNLAALENSMKEVTTSLDAGRTIATNWLGTPYP